MDIFRSIPPLPYPAYHEVKLLAMNASVQKPIAETPRLSFQQIVKSNMPCDLELQSYFQQTGFGLGNFYLGQEGLLWAVIKSVYPSLHHNHLHEMVGKFKDHFPKLMKVHLETMDKDFLKEHKDVLEKILVAAHEGRWDGGWDSEIPLMLLIHCLNELTQQNLNVYLYDRAVLASSKAFLDPNGVPHAENLMWSNYDPNYKKQKTVYILGLEYPLRYQVLFGPPQKECKNGQGKRKNEQMTSAEGPTSTKRTKVNCELFPTALKA